MKLFILTALLFSLNSFAGQIGYNCIAKNKTEEVKLDRAASQFRGKYLATVKILIVDAEDCADATTMDFKDQCRVGAFDLNVGYRKNAELVRGSTKIKLICEENGTVYGQPAGGGSN